MLQRSRLCSNAKICCKSSWKLSMPYQRNISVYSSGAKSSDCPSRRSPYVPEQQNLYFQPSYGGRASRFKRRTSDGLSKTLFLPPKRLFNTSMARFPSTLQHPLKKSCRILQHISETIFHG